MKPFRLLFAFVLITGTAAAIVSAPLVAQERARANNAETPAVQPATAKPAEQTPPPPAPPPPLPPPMTRNIQIDLTIKLDGAGPAITKQMTLVGVDGMVAMGRAGMEVPITGAGGMMNYRGVGLNVDARPRIGEGGRIALMLKLEFNSALKADSGAPSTPGAPSFGQSKTELNLALESGKPLIVSKTTDAEVGRGYTVEVKATILR